MIPIERLYIDRHFRILGLTVRHNGTLDAGVNVESIHLRDDGTAVVVPDSNQTRRRIYIRSWEGAWEYEDNPAESSEPPYRGVIYPQIASVSKEEAARAMPEAPADPVGALAAPGNETGDETGDDFASMSVQELRKAAGRAGISGAGKMRKADLMAALQG